MLKKLVLSVVAITALLGAGFAFVYKDDASLTLRTKQYHAAMDNEDYAAAYTLANQMAAEGHMPAHYYLGVLYENGNAVAQDIDIAATQYKLAASANYVPAQTHLARFYMQGVGVEKSQTLAVHWYGKAARNGSPTAQYELGHLYQNGTVKTEDPYKARTLLVSASEQGVLEANLVLADIASRDMGLR